MELVEQFALRQQLRPLRQRSASIDIHLEINKIFNILIKTFLSAWERRGTWPATCKCLSSVR